MGIGFRDLSLWARHSSSPLPLARFYAPGPFMAPPRGSGNFVFRAAISTQDGSVLNSAAALQCARE
jgi:hypothetical protein